MKLHLLALGVFALSAACAPTAQTASTGPSGRDCFNAGFISGYSNVDKDTVRVTAGVQRDYDVDFYGPGCDQIQWTNAIVLSSKPSAWICVGDSPGIGNISFRETGSRTTTSCYINEVRRYVKPASATPPAS